MTLELLRNGQRILIKANGNEDGCKGELEIALIGGDRPRAHSTGAAVYGISPKIQTV